MGRITSYHPLDRYPSGPWASVAKPPPRFADSSCRREPDLERQFPAITGLCRPNKTRTFEEGERVAYFTVGTHRLAAILEVLERFETHASAARWYLARNLHLPRNLMVRGNLPLPHELTCGFYTNAGKRIRPTPMRSPRQLVEEWDALYSARQAQAPHVLVCRRLYSNLENPRHLSTAAAKRVFPRKRFPGTQTPAKVDEAVIDALAEALGIRLSRPRVPRPR